MYCMHVQGDVLFLQKHAGPMNMTTRRGTFFSCGPSVPPILVDLTASSDFHLSLLLLHLFKLIKAVWNLQHLQTNRADNGVHASYLSIYLSSRALLLLPLTEIPTSRKIPLLYRTLIDLTLTAFSVFLYRVVITLSPFFSRKAFL